MGGIEIRMVPADWEHPRNSDGYYIPLLYGDSFFKHFAEYSEDKEMWEKGFRRDVYKTERTYLEIGEYKNMTLEDYYEEHTMHIPVKSRYMPIWSEEEKTHLMLYENISEGTPITPALESVEALAQWLAENIEKENPKFFSWYNISDYDTWLRVLKNNSAPALILRTKD